MEEEEEEEEDHFLPPHSYTALLFLSNGPFRGILTNSVRKKRKEKGCNAMDKHWLGIALCAYCVSLLNSKKPRCD